MHYHPCRFCDDGWTNGDLSNRNLTAHGGDSGWYTTAQQTYVVLYFTGECCSCIRVCIRFVSRVGCLE